jgi:carbon monoxide dehydrogenase subunit G
MKLNQSFVVNSPLSTVWLAFQNPAQLVDCLPGAQLDDSADPENLALTLKVKLGPITARFAGHGNISFDLDKHQGKFEGQAADTKNNSRVKGIADFTLRETETDATEVSVEIDFTISGTLAQFSRENIVRSLADQLTREFANNLQARLQTQESQTVNGTLAPADDAASVPGSDSSRQHSNQPLSMTKLLWRSFLHWLKQLAKAGRS